MPANYTIVDANGSLVWNFPYSKQFWALRHPGASPYFQMAVKTGYSAWPNAFSVRVNGVEINKLDPRPWTNPSVSDPELVNFIFSYSVLKPALIPGIAPFNINTLEIVPQPGIADYAFVYQVIYHWLS